jgi:exopolysaccharide biosynthesis polyprenyl glycosylphosphotransferase
MAGTPVIQDRKRYSRLKLPRLHRVAQARKGAMELGNPPVSARRASAQWIAGHINLLRLMDSLIIFLAVLLGQETAGTAFLAGSPPATATTGTVAIGIGWVSALELYRTRDSKVLGVGADEYKRVAQATLRYFGAIAITAVVFSVPGGSAFLTVTLPIGMMTLTLNRWIFRRRLASQKARGRHLSRAIVVGEPEDVQYVVHQIVRKSGPVYNILGVCLPPSHQEDTFPVDELQVPVLSSTARIAATAKLAGADAVIVAGPLPGGSKFIRELGWELEECASEMVIAATLTNVAGPRIHWRPVEGLPLMHVDIPQYSGAKHTLKRLIDMVLASAALIALMPLFLVLAAIVRFDSPGPILFRQDRVGKDGRAFGMYKFRSMVPGAEAAQPTLQERNEGNAVLFKIRNDPRVTRCGRWMRRYSFDELPQLWNVLVGHMSLVGPRPPLATEVNRYERYTYRRLLIKPGLTGLWQINGRSDLDWDEAVRLDLYYVENWSIAGDLLILWRTLRAVIRSSGAY